MHMHLHTNFPIIGNNILAFSEQGSTLGKKGNKNSYSHPNCQTTITILKIFFPKTEGKPC